MSDYQRWELMENGTMIQSPDGGWVLVGDYSCLKREAYILSIEHQNLKAENARLKAEVERLTEEYSDATNHYNKLHNDLQAEVERLRKAGDAMAETLEGVGFDSAMDFWNAANREQGCLVNPIKVAQYLPKPPAKEGKQP